MNDGEIAEDANLDVFRVGLGGKVDVEDGSSGRVLAEEHVVTIKATLAELDSTTATAQAQQAIQQPTSAAVRAVLARESLR